MANTLTGLVGPLYESLNNVSREFVGFIPGVTRDNGKFSRAALGQTVTSFTVPQGGLIDATPNSVPPNGGDQVLGSVNLTITKSKIYEIKWNGEEELGLNNNGPTLDPILQQQFQQGFRTIVNAVEQDLATIAYQNASRAAGTAGTTPFGTAGDLSDFALPAQILDENGAPAMPRTMVVNSTAMANLRGKQSVLFKVNEAGNDDLLRRGKVGMVEGFDIGYSPAIKGVTKGTGASYVLGAGSYPVGTKSLAIATGTGTVNAGDVFTLAGDTNKYVVAVGASAPGTITIGGPGLKFVHAAGDALTIGNSFTPNVAFTQDGLLLATRMPALPTDGDLGDHQMIFDTFTGMAFDVARYKGYRQVRYEVGLAWGVAAPNPEHIALLLG